MSEVPLSVEEVPLSVEVESSGNREVPLYSEYREVPLQSFCIEDRF